MRRTRVFGPAYVDRVIRVDRPLLADGVVDGSYDGQIETTIGPWRICDEAGGAIVIQKRFPRHGIEPMGRQVRVSGRLSSASGPWARPVVEKSDSSHLGGMGAGFAVAFRGELTSAVGRGGADGYDPMGEFLREQIAAHRIEHRPIRVPDRPSDWTLILTSGPFGDKLAIGFRGCHAAIPSLETADLDDSCDLLVVAALPNRLIAEALTVPARVRFLAPAMRNMKDVDLPLSSFAGRFDILSCNRREWESLVDRETVLSRTPIVAVTDGPGGCTIHFSEPDGRRSAASLPAFPREAPPRDTNRAGESFAATLVDSLLDAGWLPGPTDSELIRHAGLRASAAAALVLDREDFGFPAPNEIDAALLAGKVTGGAAGAVG